MDLLFLTIPLIVGTGVAAAATPLVARLARRADILDRPNARNVSQRENIPLLGGLAVAAGFSAALAVAIFLDDAPVNSPRLLGLCVGAGFMLAVGVYDDRKGLSAWPKGTLCAVGALIAIASGFRIEYVTDPVSLASFSLPSWLSWVITLLWIVGITNAINLVDGLDGLATGVGVIIGLTLTVIAWQVDQMFGVFIGIALAAGLLGFLPFNFSPARIFLGDTGSLFTGYLLSLLALEGYRQVTLLTFVVPLLALAVPILDTLLSILRRLRNGTSVFSPDRQHMHHRLLATEGSHRSAVMQFYILTAAFCLIAVSFTKLQGFAAAGFLAAVLLLTIRLLRNLGLFSNDNEDGEPPEILAGEDG
jgi:UDP-GlcNAc:undecaprenyl-phosphate GlcNAc-1-phosphate transferase